MRCAIKELKPHNDNEYINSAIKALEKAVILADKYYKLKWSIIWIESKIAKKKSLSAELNLIAYDCYTFYIEAFRQLKMQINTESEPKPQWLKEATICMNLVHYSFQEEHMHEIHFKQLKLDF
jgi:hypothetical protein